MAGKTTGFAGKRRCDRRMTRGLPAVERKICTTALRPLSQQSMPSTAMIWAPARTSPTNGDPSVTPVTCSNAWGGETRSKSGVSAAYSDLSHGNAKHMWRSRLPSRNRVCRCRDSGQAHQIQSVPQTRAPLPQFCAPASPADSSIVKAPPLLLV